MDKQARLEGVGAVWRFVVTRIRTLAPTLPGRIAPALRLGRRLLPLTQPWLWRYALLPVAVTVSLLIASGHSISWWMVAGEALAVICALSGWGILRAYRPAAQPDYAYLGSGAGLLLVAALITLALAHAAAGSVFALGVAALALMALDVAPTYTRFNLPEMATLVAHRIAAPVMLGVGLVIVTTLTQQAHMTSAFWLLGGALSLLVFASIQARAMAAARDASFQPAFWRRPLPYLAVALLTAGALIVLVAVPRGAPHGLLMALGALPLALVAVTGLGRSTFVPAREWAARRVGAVFTWAGLALTAGALASAGVTLVVDALIKTLGL